MTRLEVREYEVEKTAKVKGLFDDELTLVKGDKIYFVNLPLADFHGGFMMTNDGRVWDKMKNCKLTDEEAKIVAAEVAKRIKSGQVQKRYPNVIIVNL